LLASSMMMPLMLAACASGGGGGGGSITTVTPATIGAFAQPTVGTTPPSTPAGGFEQAAPGGPTFRGVQPANGTVFALTQSVFKVAHDSNDIATAIAADTATNAAGATVTVSDNTQGTYELKIPSLSVDAVLLMNDFYYSKLANGTYLAIESFTGRHGTNLLNYAVMGDWSLLDTTGVHTTNAAYYIFGYQTPVAGMPATGTATYTATNNVSGEVLTPSNSVGANITPVSGDGSLTANFATGALTGTFTNMVSAAPGGGTNTWNNLSLTGTIADSNFTGTTAATTAPVARAALLASATGTFTGGFYGPVANELALVWTLSDGTSSAEGVFGADQNSPPATIGAFEAATPGTPAPSTPATGYQLASGVSPTFTGTGPSAGTAFALTQSSLAVTFTPGDAAATVTADTATDTAGATLTALTNNANTQYELKIPHLAVDVTLQANAATETKLANGTYAYLSTVTTSGGTNLLDYAVLGAWNLNDTADQNATNTGFFIIGYQTPPAGMPGSGSATYSGTGNVYGQVTQPNAAGGSSAATLFGDGSLTANFSTGGITGTLSNITASFKGTSSAWNTVSITGAINAGASTFNGATATPSAPGTTYSLAAGATGTIRGGFYGPTAQQVAAVWTLSDGTKSALGVFGAKQAPSDRRLKRDIVPIGVVNGVKLYRFRYLASDRTFVGVMAQDLLADPRHARAVFRRPSGLLVVDYGRLGLDIPDIEAMRAAGEVAVATYEMAVAA
jgi:hypothetical protein